MESVDWNIKFPFICSNNPSLSRNIIVPEFEAQEMTLHSLQQKLISENLNISFRDNIFPSDLNITDNRDIFPILFKQERNPEQTFQIFVKTLTGKTTTLDVSSWET
jgi:hypothetical protein